MNQSTNQSPIWLCIMLDQGEDTYDSKDECPTLCFRPNALRQLVWKSDQASRHAVKFTRLFPNDYLEWGTFDVDCVAVDWGALAGLKLPSGRTGVTNDDGDAAERSLQPGTGTTDAFAGGFYQLAWPRTGVSAFVQGVYGSALNSYRDYRPGHRTNLDAGLRYDATPQWALLLQLNALWRGRDSGAQAEPEDSGGRFLFLSPGLSWSPGRDLQLFALVQLPLYQYVNGVQLTAAWGATAGLGWRF